jgi:hypothetical protein
MVYLLDIARKHWRQVEQNRYSLQHCESETFQYDTLLCLFLLYFLSLIFIHIAQSWAEKIVEYILLIGRSRATLSRPLTTQQTEPAR